MILKNVSGYIMILFSSELFGQHYPIENFPAKATYCSGHSNKTFVIFTKVTNKSPQVPIDFQAPKVLLILCILL
jgi:hypothetical protein